MPPLMGYYMSVIEPSSTIHICSVPMKMGNPNQLIFSTKAQQDAYFANASDLRTIEDCTYIRKDGVLRVPINIERIRRDNYVYYTNEHYSNKVFYAFIESMEYANDNTTFVRIRTDYWQTYMFDIRYRPVFIERETVGSDNVGEHTYPEGLELGEYIPTAVADYDLCNGEGLTKMYTVFALTDVSMFNIPQEITNQQACSIYGGNYSGLYYIAFPNSPRPREQIERFKAYMAHHGQSDAIYACFTVPYATVKNQTLRQTVAAHAEDPSLENFDIYWIYGTVNSIYYTSFEVNRVTALDGYTPKNKKLLTFPHCYFNVTNNTGVTTTFHYEDFASSTAQFDIFATFNVGGSARAVPSNLKHLVSEEWTDEKKGYSYGINAQQFPTCSWTTDLYTNWLTQNALNIENTEVFGAIHAIGGAIGAGNTSVSWNKKGVAKMGDTSFSATGAATPIVGYFETIANLSAEKYQHYIQPDAGHGDVINSDLNVAAGKAGFTVYKYAIRAEYARKIDEYLSAFGYKINRIKKPELFTRRYWNFVKTVGCLFEGKVPNEALDELTAMFDAGITFWHDPEKFGEYDNTNSIV